MFGNSKCGTAAAAAALVLALISDCTVPRGATAGSGSSSSNSANMVPLRYQQELTPLVALQPYSQAWQVHNQRRNTVGMAAVAA